MQHLSYELFGQIKTQWPNHEAPVSACGGLFSLRLYSVRCRPVFHCPKFAMTQPCKRHVSTQPLPGKQQRPNLPDYSRLSTNRRMLNTHCNPTAPHVAEDVKHGLS